MRQGWFANAIKEFCNRGHGRPPQQPIEGLTPQSPEIPPKMKSSTTSCGAV